MATGIIWDLDGTLLDTLQDLADAVNYTLARMGYPPRDLREIRSFVGNGVARLIALAVPDGADVQAALAIFRTYYAAHCQDKTAPYAGIPDALAVLRRHYPMAVVSNKPDAAVKALCAAYFPGLYAVGEHGSCPRKPSPEMVFEAMHVIGANHCIYVGDSEVDIATAQNASMPCLSVLWGFRAERELRRFGANHFCREPAELPAAIERMAKNGE